MTRTFPFTAAIVAVVAVGCLDPASPGRPTPADGPDRYDALEMGETFDGQDAARWAALPFDRITLRRSGCYGYCPAYEVDLMRGGSCTYLGIKFAPRQGRFQGTVSLYHYALLCSLAERTGILELENIYEASVSDDETITLEIVHNGRTNTTADYGRQAPPEFHAFRALMDEIMDRIEWTAAGDEG